MRSTPIRLNPIRRVDDSPSFYSLNRRLFKLIKYFKRKITAICYIYGLKTIVYKKNCYLLLYDIFVLTFDEFFIRQIVIVRSANRLFGELAIRRNGIRQLSHEKNLFLF